MRTELGMRLFGLACLALLLTPCALALDYPSGAQVLTGKERLGEKWMDEQRIDNCKVPLDKRGAKPRPAGCSHSLSR